MLTMETNWSEKDLKINLKSDYWFGNDKQEVNGIYS